MKATIQRLLGRSGYELRRINKKRPPSSDAFEVAFSTLMSTKECAAIVQVGANDGTLNDPLHPMLRKFSARTKILLIEPQPTLIARLSENYKFHPDATIHNGAVGINGQLELYSISEAAWADLDIPYAKEWPIYRAPTGVTSASRKHVSDWLERYYKGSKPKDEVIERLLVPSSPLLPLLDQYGWDRSIDVLQIDAEGHDDDVIYQSDIARTRPALINFEWHSLADASRSQVQQHLEINGYTLYSHGGDMLAVSDRRLTSFT